MKNLFIIPTDKYKSSRLVKNGKKLLLVDIPKNYTFFGSTVSVNIYITNDEEIKEGDWVLFMFDEVTEIVKVTTIVNNAFDSKEGFGYGLEYSKKIILTTDQDLIKELEQIDQNNPITRGSTALVYKQDVQPIDDEFLEWFVKNPSCEKVETHIVKLCTNCGQQYCDNRDCRGYDDKPQYLISYPQNTTKQTIVYCDGYEVGRKEVIIPKEEPKQETLEEVAERLNPYVLNGRTPFKEGFVTCAKWMKERSYSEEDMRTAWNSSEQNMRFNFSSSLYKNITFEQWIEQFKKK